jgi:membrane dipeptidase
MATLIDLHAHPSMKTYLTGAHLGHRKKTDKGFNPFTLRTSHGSLADGGLSLVCSAIYVPERQLKSDCGVIKLASLVHSRLRHALRDSPYQTCLAMLDHIEGEVAAVNQAGMTPAMRIVSTRAEMDHVISKGEIGLIHTVEGAHVLEQDPARVALLKSRGVQVMTLAHFYPNGVAPPVEAIPHDMFLRKLGCFKFVEDLNAPLPPLGRTVVEEMFRCGMIVDLTHCTVPARREVYAIPNPHHRPLMMSHVGNAALRDNPMNANPDDIAAIAASGGVIGVIFYNYWLTDQSHQSDSLSHVVDHVVALVAAGGEDLVAFGSDFDGMTDPPDDLREPAQWLTLITALERRFTPAQVDKFLGGNAYRVLAATLP